MSYSDWENKTADFRKVDVRGIQGNFFPGLKKQAMSLGVGEGLEVIQTFEPIPLYEVMEGLGFEHHTEQVADTEYHAYFYRTEIGQESKDIPMRPAALTYMPLIDEELGKVAVEFWDLTWNDGKYLATKGVVVVTLNYRLGIEGFLPVVRDGELSANRGFYDQQCALSWVRKHIALFGGDDENITLMGQSAGGLSAFTQMLSKDSPQYFDKLIICSAGEPKCMTAECTVEVWETFQKENSITSAEQLISMYGKKLLKYRTPLEVTSSPVLDGILLSDDAPDSMKEGCFPTMPVLVGSTGDEMKMVDNKSWYKRLGIAMNETDFAKKCETIYGSDGTRLAEAIRKDAKDLPYLQFKMIEIPMFHASVLKALENFSKKTDAYGYRMNYVPAIWGGLRGAYHCTELPFFFETIRDIKDTPLTEENRRQSEFLEDDWIHFIRTEKLKDGVRFGDSDSIRIYGGTEFRDAPFPYADEVRGVYDGELFDRLQKDFMRGRDQGFIA